MGLLLLAFPGCRPADEALMEAVVNQEVGNVRRLLEGGADPNVAPEGTRHLPLEAAARGGNPEIVSLLLEKGAVPDSTISLHSPLWQALINAKADAAIALTKGGAWLNGPLVDGQTPLYYAVMSEEHVLVEEMLKEGADPHSPGLWGTPLHQAAEHADSAMVGILLRAGAEHSRSNEFGETPIFLAFGSDTLDAAEALVAGGADLNHPNALGEALIFGLVEAERGMALEKALALGADPNATNKAGETPLHRAAEKGLLEMAALLLRHGADPSARAGYGATPARIAFREGHDEVLDLITEAGGRLR